MSIPSPRAKRKRKRTDRSDPKAKAAPGGNIQTVIATESLSGRFRNPQAAR
ncbi:hypothetical protein FOYG_02301 [Fusarium oxysporum NRRL 32931]|uniref:Uncharacterized protein n=1 Tax=Fusarium oxysporum NRRL 32931 TaxID=660029 RepID=W9IS34_FUSOX|nr:hypothetical protein FOYG_02301 [Fusarium oxysporum NRRL 32931]